MHRWIELRFEVFTPSCVYIFGWSSYWRESHYTHMLTTCKWDFLSSLGPGWPCGFWFFFTMKFSLLFKFFWLDPQLLLSFLDLFLSWLQKSLFPVFPICLPFISLFLNSWMVLLIWNMMWWCIAATTTSTYGYTEHDTASLYSLCEAQHVKQAWTLRKH